MEEVKLKTTDSGSRGKSVHEAISYENVRTAGRLIGWTDLLQTGEMGVFPEKSVHLHTPTQKKNSLDTPPNKTGMSGRPLQS